jgi:hypothetical protein
LSNHVFAGRGDTVQIGSREIRVFWFSPDHPLPGLDLMVQSSLFLDMAAIFEILVRAR